MCIIKTYIENLIINNEYNSLISLLGINFLLILIIWILGISIIGVIINLFISFVKVFIMSLEITTLINLYQGKGLLLLAPQVSSGSRRTEGASARLRRGHGRKGYRLRRQGHLRQKEKVKNPAFLAGFS